MKNILLLLIIFVSGFSTFAQEITITNLNSNSEYSDFGGYESNGTFYFSSSSKKYWPSNFVEKEIFTGNNEPFLNIFKAKVERTKESIQINEISFIDYDSINLPDEHEGTMALTSDGKTLYFTRNNVRKGKRAFDGKGSSNLKLYRAVLINNQWENINELPFSGNGYSTGHPALSPDEKTLYFVSDTLHKDAQGATDLYKVSIYGDGTFGELINLKEVNTAKREMFPFIAKDSTLYFSSDSGQTGMLDIFKSDILKNDNATKENLGAPFNSEADDFAFFLNDDEVSGYFSSNRKRTDGTNWSDDIYSFFINKECLQSISGITYDRITNQAIAGVTVTLTDGEGNTMGPVISNANGEYSFMGIVCETNYTITGKKTGYTQDSKTFTSSNINGEERKEDLYLTPIEIKIGRILFEFNKAVITRESELELDKLVAIMNDYENMIINIESHTDLRGSKAYNEGLSKRRAESTFKYINTQGIDATRLTYMGFGECKPRIKCGNYCDVDRPELNPCSNADHDQNRRSVFRIANPMEIPVSRIDNTIDQENNPK